MNAKKGIQQGCDWFCLVFFRGRTVFWNRVWRLFLPPPGLVPVWHRTLQGSRGNKRTLAFRLSLLLPSYRLERKQWEDTLARCERFTQDAPVRRLASPFATLMRIHCIHVLSLLTDSFALFETWFSGFRVVLYLLCNGDLFCLMVLFFYLLKCAIVQ